MLYDAYRLETTILATPEIPTNERNCLNILFNIITQSIIPTHMFIRIISIICFLASGYIINKVIPPKRRNIIMFIIVLTICVITGIISIVQEGKYRSENRIARLEEKLGNIYFQGKVISSFTKYEKVLLCILIDTTNTPYYLH